MLSFGRIGAAALATVVLAAGVVGAARGNEKYFPKDTEVLVHLNVRQLLDSELVKTHKEVLDGLKTMLREKIEGDQQAQKYMKMLGFDVFRDLDSVTLALPGSGDVKKGLVVFHGKFDRQKFSTTAQEAAKEHGDVLKVTRQGTFEVVELTPPGEDHTMYISLVNTSTALVSAKQDVLTAALAREATTQAPELAPLVRDLRAKQGTKETVTFVATSKALTNIAQEQAKKGGKGQLDMTGQVLQKIDGFNGYVDVQKDVTFQIGVITKGADAAKELSQQVTFGVGMAAAMVGNKAKEEPKVAPWVDVVRSIRSTTQGNVVVIHGQIPAAVIEQALKNQ